MFLLYLLLLTSLYVRATNIHGKLVEPVADSANKTTRRAAAASTNTHDHLSLYIIYNRLYLSMYVIRARLLYFILYIYISIEVCRLFSQDQGWFLTRRVGLIDGEILLITYVCSQRDLTPFSFRNKWHHHNQDKSVIRIPICWSSTFRSVARRRTKCAGIYFIQFVHSRAKTWLPCMCV